MWLFECPAPARHFSTPKSLGYVVCERVGSHGLSLWEAHAADCGFEVGNGVQMATDEMLLFAKVMFSRKPHVFSKLESNDNERSEIRDRCQEKIIFGSKKDYSRIKKKLSRIKQKLKPSTERKESSVLWCSGALVPWSSGPLVLWSPGPLVLWSPGPPVLWSSGPLVLWSLASM